jgi:fibro-slime domain-containing protein
MGNKTWTLALAIAVTACNNDVTGQLGGPGGGSGQNYGGNHVSITGPAGFGGATGAITADGQTGQLIINIRDFKFYSASDSSTVPDFENVPKADQSGAASTTYTGPWDDKEIVATQLGSDHKPVYKNASGTTLTTHGKSYFDKWFSTVPNTNILQAIPLTLTKSADGSYQYDSQSGGPLSPGGMFFPIDDGTQYKTAFGNQGMIHNYSFTGEIHTLFTYQGGETFHFSGDDDVFVFINNNLVINLGGIHSREQADVSIDSLNLTKGSTYPLDFFYAERHKNASNLLITTTLQLVVNTDIPVY